MNMFILLRHKTFGVILSLMVVIQVANLSIDAVDPFPNAEDLTVNEIESCLELIVEIVLNHQDAIEETEDSDHSSYKTGAGIVLFSVASRTLTFDNCYKLLCDEKRSQACIAFLSLSATVISPPPKTA